MSHSNSASAAETNNMGSLPQLSVVKGPQRDLKRRLVHKLIEENIARSGGHQTAIIQYADAASVVATTTISYYQLNANANCMAACMLQQIRGAAAKPNQDGDWIVAVCMPPSDRLVTALLAIWKAGAAYLPIDVAFPHNRIEHILAEAKPVLVIYDEYAAPEIFSATNYIAYADLQVHARQCSALNIPTKDTLGGGGGVETNIDLAIVLYTSGSTGVPKGVRLPHSIVLNRLQWQFEAFPYSPTEKTGVFKTALTFVDSVSEIWGPLLNGK